MLPEQQELTRLETEQAGLEEQVISAELTLETIKSELSQFQYHYNQTIGRLFVELDELDAKIALVEAGLHPDDVEAQFRAQAAQAQAQKSAEEAGVIESKPPPPEITPEIKQAFRQAAKLMHPDRATTDTERERRNVMMAKVNRAYEVGDLPMIEKLIVEFGEDPEAIKGEDVGARLIKAIRRIAQLRRRFSEAEKELAELQQHELYELMATVQETEAMGGDTLGDLTQHLMQQISERKIQLEMLRHAMDANSAAII
ncbi:J domain-containing protein [Methylovulum miyakonense]|uniref:J domain-containing protein n=1 Tax=Methylovulum miyakonense TaxID=645578 RepID=UPI00037C6BFE|nr:J domain-containing protein [Methylovulum miyakonense]